jgi:GST-like protein
MKRRSSARRRAGLTLFGARGSGSAAVEMALRTCGLRYQAVRAATWEADSALTRLRRVNPLGQVPTLVLTDGTVLTESAAILIHLGLAYPNSRLLPRAASARAQAIRGLVFIAANCYSAIGVKDYPERWTTARAKAAREQLRRGAVLRLHRYWEIFADTFVPKPYLSGRSPGALDFLAAVVSRWAGTRAHLARHRPRLLKVLERIETHHSVAELFKAHWDG